MRGDVEELHQSIDLLLWHVAKGGQVLATNKTFEIFVHFCCWNNCLELLFYRGIFWIKPHIVVHVRVLQVVMSCLSINRADLGIINQEEVGTIFNNGHIMASKH